MFGAPRVVRNMNVTGRRKVPRKNIFVEVKPELLELEEILSALKISREQLVEIGILVGTDFNEGVMGIGPKKALAHITQKPLKEWVKEGKFKFEVDFEELKKIFLKPEITKSYTAGWRPCDPEKLIEILHERHEFSKERIENALKKLEESKGAKSQKSLDSWLK